MEKIWRSGIIPYYMNDKNQITMLFMIPSNTKYGGDQYQLGKGRIDGNETPEEAALREGHEELGLKGNNIMNIFKVGIFLGRTHVFAVNILDSEDFDNYTLETSAVDWMTLTEFELRGRRLHVDLVTKTCEMIATYENL